MMVSQSRLWGEPVGSIDVTAKVVDDKDTYGKDVMHSCFHFKNNQCYFLFSAPGRCDGCSNWVCFNRSVIYRLFKGTSKARARHIDYYDLLEKQRKVIGTKKSKLSNDTTIQKTL